MKDGSKDARFEALIQASETRTYKLVFPHTTNQYDTLFGGTALEWMDEVAFITATRFSRQKVVTVSMDRIDFKKPIPSGTVVELIGRVNRVGNTSVGVKIEVWKEDMYAQHRELAVSGLVTFVAIDDQRNPTPLSVHDGQSGNKND
jgi:acyl-CoA hydrolase